MAQQVMSRHETILHCLPSGPGAGGDAPRLGRQGIGAYRALRAVAGEILATADSGQMLERCGAVVQELLRADACTIGLLDERLGNLHPLLTVAGGRSAQVAPLPLDQLDGRMRAAIHEGRSLIVAHGMVLDGDEPLPLDEEQSVLTAMLLPLPLGQDVRGILWVARIHGTPFTADDQALAETLAALVALGIQSALGGR